ncbi:MAG: hypothetical protein P8125_08475 [Gemmatimonadota bacterium]
MDRATDSRGLSGRLELRAIERLADSLRTRRPASLEICALLHKHVAIDLSIEPRWVGFDAPSDFLVGYGLDHAEDYRHLPFVASIHG